MSTQASPPSKHKQSHGRCFVISPIGAEDSEVRRHADEVFEHIVRPAMERCGLVPYRSDHLSAPGRISGQMFERILGDDLCIAVLTGYNPNVFYELAIAHFARRPVIIMLEKGRELPFDVNDLRCLYYDFWPSSIMSGEYVEELVKQVEDLRALNWQVPEISPELKDFRAGDSGPNVVKLHERSADFGPDSQWLALLESADTFFSIMGVSLLSWVKTKNFESTVLQKAESGCLIRIMTLHLSNPSIKELEESRRADESAEHVREQIRLSSKEFRRWDAEVENVTYRQLGAPTPNFALTLTDKTALLVQYLHSLNWGLGPHLQCGPASPLYAIVSKEFEELWKIAETVK